eukprot:jgi/Chlat1/8413/Chrsp80S07836
MLELPREKGMLAGLLRPAWVRLLRVSASLPLAISELAVIAGMSAVGTVIEQNRSTQFYFETYPDNPALFGFLTGGFILQLGLDHVYTTWYFLALLAGLAFSLSACTWTRQRPLVKSANRWRFARNANSLTKLEVNEALPNARLGDVALALMTRGYQVFASGPALYAFKGVAGRLAPIGVHASLILIMGGGAAGALTGFHGSAMIPEGQDFIVGEAMEAQSPLAGHPDALDAQVYVNDFHIDYLPTGEVSQFYSDLSLYDPRTNQVTRKMISVNDPLRYGGVTMYQTDWSIAAIQLRVGNGEPIRLAMGQLQKEGGKSDDKLYAAYLPTNAEDPRQGVSMLARTLEEVVLYDKTGKFVGVRRPGSNKPIEVNGVSLVIEQLTGSTGLELKMDPGVPWVYAGFGGLMLTTFLSYLSHSQVWALQQGSSVHVGGKTNRATLAFRNEMSDMFDEVPEYEGPDGGLGAAVAQVAPSEQTAVA